MKDQKYKRPPIFDYQYEPGEMADMIFDQYYNWVKLINYSVDSEKLLKGISVDMALICVNITLKSHYEEDEKTFWLEVKNLLKSKL